MSGFVVSLGERTTQTLDHVTGEAENLTEQRHRHRLGGHEQNRFECAYDVGVDCRCGSGFVVHGSTFVIVDRDRADGNHLVTDPDDVDITELLGLVDVDVPLLEEFQQGQETHDDLDAIDQVGGQTTERDPTDARQLVGQFGQSVGHVGLDDPHVEEIDLGFGFRSGRSQVRGVNLFGLHTLQEVGHQLGESLVGSDHARETTIGALGQFTEHSTDVLEGLAFEQPGEEKISFLPESELFVEVDVFTSGKEPTSLQFDQRGGDQQEFGGHVEIEELHLVDLGQIRVDDESQIHLVDVDLLFQNKVQQQVEGPFENRCAHVDGHDERLIGPAVSDRSPPDHATSLVRVTRVLSCIQPTGPVHLGNYLGALRNWVSGQHECDAFHGIVDLHALTVTDRPGVVGENTLELAAALFAVGLDPDVATVFVQSHVPEHTQLGWIMECTVSYGELSRMTQFKDKATKREADFVSAGLFTYPALQAADILLYDADDVPVGEDQRQHIEITRDIAERFNTRFGDTFVVPKMVTPKAGAKVTDLQEPTAKMSKSSVGDSGIVYLLDDPAAIMKKFKRAVTDSDSEVRFDRANKPGVSNLLEILAACTGRSPEEVAAGYQQYGPLKVDTGEAVVEVLRPIQERYRSLLEDRAELSRLLRRGADKAREVAAATLARAYRNIGLLPLDA